MSVIANKEFLLSLALIVTSHVCGAYHLPYCPQQKHHLPYRIDVPAKETYIKVLTPVEPPPLDMLPPPPPPPPQPPPLYDCDNDVYELENQRYDYGTRYGQPAAGYLQKYVPYNEEQC